LASFKVSCWATVGQLRPIPGLVRIRDPGGIEHRLVVVQGNDVEVARQTELPVGRGEVGNGLIGELREVVSVALDEGLEVEQDVARLVIGEERPVHREDVRCIAAASEVCSLSQYGSQSETVTLTVILGLAAWNASTIACWFLISCGSPPHSTYH
jgi:hypothetical protein